MQLWFWMRSMIFYKESLVFVKSFAVQNIAKMKPSPISHCLLLAALLATGTVNAQSANTVQVNTKKKESDMSVIQQNKATIQKLFDQSLNKRNLALLKELIADDFVGIRGLKGAAGFQEPVLALMKSFPDIQWKVEEMVGEGDKVTARWTVAGTHTEPFNNLAPTGNKVANTGIGFFALKDGKVVSAQVQTDRLGFLQELDVLPDDVNVIYARKPQQGQVRFIDKFLVPANAKQEFLERVKINRDFIKKLPGFVEDVAYERTDEQGNLIFITVALWQNEEVMQKAKEAVQAEYKKQGFNPAAMFERLHITMDRGIYKEAQ